MLLGDDIITSHEIEKWICRLRDKFTRTPFGNSIYSADRLERILNNTPEEWKDATEEWDEDEVWELIAFVAAREKVMCEMKQLNWDGHLEFVHDNYFEDHAKDVAQGNTDEDLNAWPYVHIDWSEAAAELKNKYEMLDIGDHVYWVKK